MDVEARATELLDRFAERFDPKRRELLHELVEHDEAGVAFEMVVGMLAHGEEPISADDLRFLRELGRDWETARDPIPWDLLEAKVEQ